MSTVCTRIQAAEPSAAADLTLPRTILRSWNIPPDGVMVQFGMNTAWARTAGSTSRQVARVKPDLADSLRLPSGSTVMWRYDQERNRLLAGPLIGVLLSRIHADNQFFPFGALTSYLNELSDLCGKRGGVVCVFTLDDVNWDSRKLRGLIRRGGRWHKQVLPLPSCIYNRLAFRQKERTETVAAWIDRCKEFHIPFFNERFLNKWHVHKALSGDAEVLSLLPDTTRYQSQDDLKSMLNRFPVVYAKPTNGSMGKGIIRISRRGERYQLATGRSVRRLSGFAALTKALNKRTKNTPYLLQQGLNLIRTGRRTADFRILLQKNGRGEWTVTSQVARLGPNSVVSNVAQGGSMLPVGQALGICGGWKTARRPTAESLKQTALAVAQAVDRSIAGHYAELGIDLGVDTHGRIWLLEVNSKPSKAPNTLRLPDGGSEPPRRARPSAKRLHEYAAFVSGFPQPTETRQPKKRRRHKSKRR